MALTSHASRTKLIKTAALAAIAALALIATSSAATASEAPAPDASAQVKATPGGEGQFVLVDDLEFTEYDDTARRSAATVVTPTAAGEGNLQVVLTHPGSPDSSGTIYVEDLYGELVAMQDFEDVATVNFVALPVGTYRVYVDFDDTYQDAYTERTSVSSGQIVAATPVVPDGLTVQTYLTLEASTATSIVGILRAPASWTATSLCIAAIDWNGNAVEAWCGYRDEFFRLDFLTEDYYAFMVVPGTYEWDYQFEALFQGTGTKALYGTAGSNDIWFFILNEAGVYWMPLYFFTDVEASSQFFDHITWMADSGISTGYDDGSFRPSASVSRQAMAAFMYRFAGEPAFTPPAVSPFTDVPTSNQFYLEITWMAHVGISTGYDDDTFRPTAAVSRQAMAAFMYRFAGEPAFSPPGVSPFSDVATGGQFYLPITWMADEEISTGYDDDTFRPAVNVSRQAMAAFMLRLNSIL